MVICRRYYIEHGMFGPRSKKAVCATLELVVLEELNNLKFDNIYKKILISISPNKFVIKVYYLHN